MVAPVGIDPTTAADEALVLGSQIINLNTDLTLNPYPKREQLKLVETIVPLTSDWIRKVALTCESLY
jgi:hypothetical protein